MYKIMLADDEGIVIDSLKFIIEKEFKDICEVQYAKTGRSVIELAESFRPDIAVMDIQMPVLDGYQAADKIRALDRTDAKTVPIVAMTANAFIEDVKTAKEHGMNGHVAKPLEVRELTAALKKWIPGFKTKNQS